MVPLLKGVSGREEITCGNEQLPQSQAGGCIQVEDMDGNPASLGFPHEPGP